MADEKKPAKPKSAKPKPKTKSHPMNIKRAKRAAKRR
jgi:hypothetical protein